MVVHNVLVCVVLNVLPVIVVVVVHVVVPYALTRPWPSAERGIAAPCCVCTAAALVGDAEEDGGGSWTACVMVRTEVYGMPDEVYTMPGVVSVVVK